jgi:purine-binding chemotaxis protein CheW
MVAASQLPDLKPWLVCRSGSYLCALPLADVVETLRPLAVEPLAGVPPFISGISVIRGLPTPVVDLSVFLGDPDRAPTRFVSLLVANRRVALAVAAVHGVHQFTALAQSTLPPLLKNVAGDALSAVGTLDRELLFFFETARMIPPGFLERIERTRGAS